MDVLKIAQLLLTINIQRLLCTVIKFHVVQEAVLYFLKYFNVNFVIYPHRISIVASPQTRLWDESAPGLSSVIFFAVCR